MTNSLQAMAQRRDQWLNEKPQGGFGNELRLDEGDQAYFQFVSNGKDGDTYIKVYRSHAIASKSKTGKDITNFRYCVKANDDQDCQYCNQELTDVKERMSIWMYITTILRAKMPTNTPPDKMLPQINYNGRTFFKEDVNDFRIWHTSAWKESPWADILTLDRMYSGLGDKFSAELSCHGSGFSRRYKVYAIPNSPGMTAEIYAAAKEKCQPVLDILRGQLAGPVAVNPNAQQQAQPQVVGNVIPWTPPGGGSVPGATESFVPFANPETPAQAPQAAAPPWEPSGDPAPAQQPPAETPPQDLPLSSMF